MFSKILKYFKIFEFEADSDMSINLIVWLGFLLRFVCIKKRQNGYLKIMPQNNFY